MHSVNINSFYLSRKAKHHRRILMNDGHSLIHTAILSVQKLLVTRILPPRQNTEDKDNRKSARGSQSTNWLAGHLTGWHEV